MIANCGGRTMSKPTSEEKRKKQITALRWQIENDTNDKDREIHVQALRELLMGKSRRS